MSAAERHFPRDHPSARGHFPGDPIIPGAVLLNEVLRAITEQLDTVPVAVHLRQAKFLRPTRPGDRVVIEFSATLQGQVRFQCTVDGKSVLTGEVRWQDMPTAS